MLQATREALAKYLTNHGVEPLLADISESTALERAGWRLRRSTYIGGIATDHGATVRAARLTPPRPSNDTEGAYRGQRRYAFSDHRGPSGRLPRRRTSASSTPAHTGGRDASLHASLVAHALPHTHSARCLARASPLDAGLRYRLGPALKGTVATAR